MIRKKHKRRIIDQAIHETLNEYSNDRLRKEAFVSLLDVVRRESDLLSPEHILREDDSESLKICFHGLCNITYHYRDWIRKPLQWTTDEESLLKQYQGLVNYLFTNHPVPNFMIRVWLEKPSAECWKKQIWYKHIGLGNSIRGADLPVTLSKKMVQVFLNTPDHFSIEQALTGSIYGTPKKITPFYFGTSRKRRKWLIVKWNQFNQEMNKFWKRAPFSGFKYVEEDLSGWSYRLWSIQQLRNHAELIKEGDELHHCVADYSRSCSLGETTIWSMQCCGRLSTYHSVTIEVNPRNRQIIQARGKFNRWPTDQEEEIIRKWAEQENLRVAI